MKELISNVAYETLADCPPGFFLYKDEVCFKSEYHHDDTSPIAYCSTGEYFWGGTTDIKARDQLKVLPLRVKGSEL